MTVSWVVLVTLLAACDQASTASQAWEANWCPVVQVCAEDDGPYGFSVTVSAADLGPTWVVGGEDAPGGCLIGGSMEEPRCRSYEFGALDDVVVPEEVEVEATLRSWSLDRSCGVLEDLGSTLGVFPGTAVAFLVREGEGSPVEPDDVTCEEPVR